MPWQGTRNNHIKHLKSYCKWISQKFKKVFCLKSIDFSAQNETNQSLGLEKDSRLKNRIWNSGKGFFSTFTTSLHKSSSSFSQFTLPFSPTTLCVRINRENSPFEWYTRHSNSRKFPLYIDTWIILIKTLKTKIWLHSFIHSYLYLEISREKMEKNHFCIL